jgi:hypothetical protein
MEMRAQLEILQSAVESQHRAEEINAANDALRISLALRQESVQRLHRMSLATAALVGSVDSTSPRTEQSSLQLLTKIPISPGIDQSKEVKTTDSQFKGLIGKFLNQLLAMVAQASKQGQQKLNLVTMIDLELKLHERFAFAEEHNLIPKTDENSGWKKGTAARKGLYDQILTIKGEAPRRRGRRRGGRLNSPISNTDLSSDAFGLPNSSPRPITTVPSPGEAPDV